MARARAEVVEALVPGPDRDRSGAEAALVAADRRRRVDDAARPQLPAQPPARAERVEVAVGRADVGGAVAADHRRAEDPPPGRKSPRTVAPVATADRARPRVAAVAAHLGPRGARLDRNGVLEVPSGRRGRLRGCGG